MRFRTWLSLATTILLISVLIAARGQLLEAWHLLGQVNIWILLLIFPVQFMSYFASSEIIFSYLRDRGQLLKTSRLEVTRMSLELNFVNQIFPSSGVAGISYMVWRLGKLDVPAGQTTITEIMRYVVQISTFFVLMILALMFTAIDNKTSNWLIMVISIAVTAIIFVVIFGSFLMSDKKYLESFAGWITRVGNLFVGKITFGRARNKIKLAKLNKFFMEFRDDFLLLKQDKKLLIKPIIWAFIYNMSDAALFFVTFWALGVPVSPAILLIGYGLGAFVGTLAFTPAGAGAYEVIMAGILVSGGVPADQAIAGVVLARAILVITTIVTGFGAYQGALRKYGKPKLESVAASDDEISDSDEKKNRSE